MIEKYPKLEEEVSFSCSKSSKPGGMRALASQTRVILKWNVWNSKIFDEDQKKKIVAYFEKYASDKINKKGEIIIYSEKERSQELNKKDALEKLITLISKALKPVKKRQAIQVSPRWHETRIKEKKILSEKKQLRRKITPEEIEEFK